MELGEFRVDVNVSISDSLISMGTKCEIKNLNSFTSIASAIKAELTRQRNIIENGDKVSQCTLGFDVSKGKTYLLRTKEKEYEYNYIYDPDLPPLIVSNTVVEEIQRSTIVFDIESLLEYPVDSRNFILERPYIMNFYSDCLKTLSHKSIFTWVCNEIWKLTGNKSKFQSILMDIKTFTQAVLIYEKGACSISLLRDWLVNNLFKEGSDLSSLLYTNLVEDKFIKSVFLEILKEHTALLDQYRNGNDKALHYLTGILIQDIKKRYSGTIDSKLCAQIVKLILEEYK
jgi:aspartyl-tRNA(Asn)/glutamyl-tRNA(Gln) amidotransferase subunit B